MKRSKLKKFSKGLIPQLKRTLKIFLHPLIRRRDKKCITCDGRAENAGHYKNAGKYKSVEFDPDNIHGQCVRCNRWLHGNLDIYGDRLRKKIGEIRYRDLVKRANGYFDYTPKKLWALIAAAKIGYREYVKVYEQLRPKL